MIKVLHIVPSMHYGGVGSVVMNYYRNLNKDKIHIDFATFHVADDLKQEMVFYPDRLNIIFAADL